MTNSPPYSVFLDLGAVPEHGIERALAPTAEERQAIALWLGVESVGSLTATVGLSRKSEDHYLYEARFEAELVQACVVTLGPVPAHLSGEFRRDFRVRPKSRSRRRKAAESAPAAVELTGNEDDEADWLDEPVIDLAAPVLEELTLALDPYPRAPDVAFEAPPDEAPVRDSPFAVLEKLKADRKPPGSAAHKAPRPGKRK